MGNYNHLYTKLLHKTTAVLLLMASTASISECWTPPYVKHARWNHAVHESPQNYPVYDMSPPSGVPGREYPVSIISHDPKRMDITDKTEVIGPVGITISVTAVSKNGLTARITISKDTPIGRVQFLLKDKGGKDGTIIGTSQFDVTAIAQGPTPPGLDPQVDVMWGVMAKDVVRHNFGHKIAKHYYGIQLSIGNNTGFDLQIASVGFQLPTQTNIKNRVPTNSYRATRGTLERQQEIGTRAMVVNSLKAAGLLFTGFLPFWHAVGASANATRIADVINGPAKEGLSLVYPDTVISQLTRLDDQMLRDGLIIKNNSQVRTLVFVPKQLLNISKDEGSGDTDQIRYHGDKKKKLDYRNDPQYVNLRLGDLVLIGQPIQYLNRIQVLKTSEGGPVAPPPTLVGINPPSVEQGSDEQLLILSGSYLDNAIPSIKDPDTNDTVLGVEFKDYSTDSSGHIFKTKVKVDDSVPPKQYRLVLSTPGGSVERTFEIIQAPPSELSLTYEAGHPPTANTNEDVEVKIKITGKHLENSHVVIPPSLKEKLVAQDDAEAEDGELTQTVTVLKGTQKGPYKLKVQNTNPRSTDVELVVGAAPKK